MPVPDLFAAFLRPLNQLDLPFMVTGAVAAIVYGEPRLTHDLDIVLELEPGDSQPLIAAFPETEFYSPPREVIEEEARRESDGHFNLVHLESALRADVYLAGRDPFLHWGLARRQREEMGTESITVAPMEYVIVMKLRYFRDGGAERHLRDIERMLEISGSRLDHRALQPWIERYQLESEWARVAGGYGNA
jgi:hypothetical protein